MVDPGTVPTVPELTALDGVAKVVLVAEVSIEEEFEDGPTRETPMSGLTRKVPTPVVQLPMSLFLRMNTNLPSY